MKNVSKILLPILASLYAFSAVAADKPAHGYKLFFLVNGKQTDAQTAIIASLKGDEAFKCQSVEAKVSAAGTSIGVKNIKKPPRSASN